MNKSRIAWVVVLAAMLLVVVSAVVIGTESLKHNNSNKIKVVAAEDFWGSLVSQIGGNRVQVKSIVTDPNADPHEYETNTADARAISEANYVVLNGAGYDSWGDKVIAASPNPNRRVLKVSTLLGKKDGDNPHFWYNPSYVNEVVLRMEQDLISLDPKDASYFKHNYTNLIASLSGYQNEIKTIKQRYSGTEVSATEDVFYYLAQAAGLNLVSPIAFTRAVSEGNDPPVNSIVAFQQQLKSGKVKLLVFNTQTVTPLTDSMKTLANQLKIPVVGVSETIQPSNLSFQNWMTSEVTNILNALRASGAK